MDSTGLRVPFTMSIFLPLLQLLLISIYGAVTQPLEPSLSKNPDDISRSKLYSVLSELYHDGRFDYSNDKPRGTGDLDGNVDDSSYDNDMKRGHSGWQIAYGKRPSNKWGMAYGKRRQNERNDDVENEIDMDPSYSPSKWTSKLDDVQRFNTWKPQMTKRQQGWHIAYGKRSS